MDTKRLILFVVFSFSILLLWDTWQRKHVPVIEVTTQQDASVPSSQKLNTTDTKTISPDSNFKLETASRIKVVTDLYQIEIDTAGGDIRRLLLNNHLAEFPKEEPFYLYCAGGYRSMIAASILKSRGYDNVINVLGGFTAIINTGIKTTHFVCPSTIK